MSGPSLRVDPRCARAEVLQWMVDEVGQDSGAAIEVFSDVASFVASTKSQYAHGVTEQEAVDRLVVLVRHGDHVVVPYEIWSAYLIEPVARGFVHAINEEMLRYADGIERIDAIVERNAREGDSGVCHTHDFCDPNEFMAASILAYTGQNPSEKFMLDDDGLMALWNSAWNRSKVILADTQNRQNFLRQEAQYAQYRLRCTG